MTDIAVVIVNHDTCDELDRCLATVVPEQPAAIVVADTGSRDGSVAMVRDRYPGAIVEECPDNPGYGTAANRGIACTRTPYVLLLNSDTRLAPGALAALAGCLDSHSAAAIVGPRLMHPDGTLQRSCRAFPGPVATLLEQGALHGVARRVPGWGAHLPESSSHRGDYAVPWVLGAALAIRRSAFDAVGGFDPGYFMFSEETDLCYRLRGAGWETRFTDAATVTHVGGASTRQQRAEMYVRMFESAFRFQERHHAGARQALAAAIIKAGMVARITRDATRRLLTRDAARRGELADSLRAWRRVLAAPVRGRVAR